MKKALIGGGGHAREVLAQIGEELPCFVEDGFRLEGCWTKSLTDFDPSEYQVMVAIGDPHIRQNIIEKLPSRTCFFSFIHPTAIVVGGGGGLKLPCVSMAIQRVTAC